MNEAYKNLIERRSIRKYNNTKVSHDLMEKIVRAGQFAPSGMNRQIYAFVVVEDEELVARLSKMNADAMNSTSDPFYGAKNALGVDSCWIHRAKEVFETPEGKEMKKTWGLPESYEGIGHCILGYREEEPDKRAQRTSKVIYA